MWALRILSGQQAGRFYPLKEGANTIGRSPQAEICISDSGISKEHLKIEVLGEKILASDLGSRNGTFLNGTQIKSHRLQDFDKLALSDIFIEIRKVPSMVMNQAVSDHMQPAENYSAQSDFLSSGQAHGQSPHLHLVDNEPVVSDESLGSVPDIETKTLKQKAEDFLENSILAGIYQLPTHLEFSWVLGIFMLSFILLVTSLSTIPLLNILKESVEEESQQHALTIANNLAQYNLDPLLQGIESSVSVTFALKRPGVKEAYVLSNLDGSVIAPAHKAGSFPDIPFVPEARQRDKAEVSQVSSDTVVAVVPIQFFNAETGTQTTKAHAVIVYDMGSLAVDDGKTLSLFIQTLFIALLIGSVLFFFMFKLIEFPFKELNLQIDRALKENRDDLKLDYEFSSLQALVSNINSLLSRNLSSSGAGPADQHQFERDRSLEMRSIVDLIGFPAVAVSLVDHTISAGNFAFEDKTRVQLGDLLYKKIDAITDQALKLSIQDLLEKVQQNPEANHSNDLEFAGEPTQVVAQPVWGSHQPSYCLIVLLPELEGGAG